MCLMPPQTRDREVWHRPIHERPDRPGAGRDISISRSPQTGAQVRLRPMRPDNGVSHRNGRPVRTLGLNPTHQARRARPAPTDARCPGREPPDPVLGLRLAVLAVFDPPAGRLSSQHPSDLFRPSCKRWFGSAVILADRRAAIGQKLVPNWPSVQPAPQRRFLPVLGQPLVRALSTGHADRTEREVRVTSSDIDEARNPVGGHKVDCSIRATHRR
jgi:hypothetical protein